MNQHRGCSDLPGGWRASHHKRVSARPRPRGTECRRCSAIGGGCCGLPLFGGAQLAVDTTTVSTLHANGEPRRANVDGVALVAARQGAEVPRVGWLPLSCPFSGACSGRLWSMVKRRRRSSVLWPELKHVQFLPCCAKGWSKLGASGGVPSSPARLQGQWHRPSWNCLALGAQMVCVMPPMRWNGTSGMPAWISCWRLNYDVTRPFFSLSLFHKKWPSSTEKERKSSKRRKRERVPNKERERVPNEESESSQKRERLHVLGYPCRLWC